MKIKEYKNKDDNYEIVDGNGYLSDLKKINIFVGANNSGKSRFLRQIFITTSDDFVFFEDVNTKLKEIYDRLFPTFSNHFTMADLKNLYESRIGNYPMRFNQFYRKIEETKGRSNGIGNIWDFDVASAIKNAMSNDGIYKEYIVENIENQHVYIPIIRGLRHLDFQHDLNEKEDVYKNRINKDHGFNDDNLKRLVFSGLSIYTEIKKMLLGSREDRNFVRDFEKFLSKNFFKEKQITLIPSYNEDILNINIDDKKDREIFNVGDGIQSIIINTFTAFKYKNDNLVLFIEEPELTMHPSIQRILIETLTTQFDNLQVFLTTHSNHFLDLAYDYPDDISIFSFEEDGNEKFKIKNIGTNSKILDLLGIRNSSVFLSNCVIWTEGVTDRMFLRKLLKLHENKYKEDYNYSFAEYGGNNLENFDYIETYFSDGVNVNSITKTNFLIADNDGIIGNNLTDRKSAKYIRRKKIEKILGKDSFFDKHIEIENLIPYKIWKKVIEDILKDKSDKKIKLKDNIKDTDEKRFNDELKNKHIGTLIKKYLIEQNENNENEYFKSKTILCLGENKKTIMNYVIKAIDELNIIINDFPLMTKNLVNSITEFIKVSN